MLIFFISFRIIIFSYEYFKKEEVYNGGYMKYNFMLMENVNFKTDGNMVLRSNN